MQQQQQLQQPTAGAEQASQLGADRFVLALFDQRPSGYFVDVGAADGFKLSNSYLLEQRGWSGIAVDPLLRNFEQRRCRTVACPVYGQADVEVGSGWMSAGRWAVVGCVQGGGQWLNVCREVGSGIPGRKDCTFGYVRTGRFWAKAATE